MRSAEVEFWELVAAGLDAAPSSPDVVTFFVNAIAAVEGAEPWDRLGPSVGVAARVATVRRGAAWVLADRSWPPPPMVSPLPGIMCRTAHRLGSASTREGEIADLVALSRAEVTTMVRHVLGLDAELPADLAGRLARQQTSVSQVDSGCRDWLVASDLIEPDERFWTALAASEPDDPIAGIDLSDDRNAGSLRCAVTVILTALKGDTGVGVLDVPLACWWAAGGPYRLARILAAPDEVRLDLRRSLDLAVQFVAAQG